MHLESKPENLDPTGRRDVNPAVDLSEEPLDPDRPWLEQLEERALGDERTSELLERKIYPNRQIMSLLIPTPTQTNG